MAVSRVLNRVMSRTSEAVYYSDGTNLDTLENGIHLDFANDFHYTKAAGQSANVAPLTSLFTFTGGNESMYMGPAGLLVQSVTNTPRIEYVRATLGTNYALESENFTTSRASVELTFLSNATTAPDGTLTADKIIETTANNLHRVRQVTDITFPAGTLVQCSVFVKYAEKQFVNLRLTDNTFTSGLECPFDLIAGTAGTILTTGAATGGVTSITNVGDGWYRIAIRGIMNGGFTAHRFTIELMNSIGNSASYAGDGTSGMYLWGEQIEFGTSSTPSVYTKTTSTIPAFTNSSSSCLGLLMEASRTNLCLQSENLGTTWVPAGATVSANAIASPSGALTADAIVEDGTTGAHGISQGFTKAASVLVYTYSGWLKSNGRTLAQLRISGASTANRVAAEIDLIAGTITAATAFGTFTGASATITAYPNGWYRFALTGTSNTDTSINVVVLMETTSGVTSYTGDSSSGMYLWGAQFEQASFASSYIPTTTVAVVRTADRCSRTLGSEFVQSVGTMVAEYQTGLAATGGNQFISRISDATFGSANALLISSTGDAQISTAAASVFDGLATAPGGVVSANTWIKHSGAWAANDLASSRDGGAVGTDNSATMFTSMTRLDLCSDHIGANRSDLIRLRRFDYYPKRENNGFLQRASTL